MSNIKDLKPYLALCIVKLGGNRNLDYVELAKMHNEEKLTPRKIADKLNRSINTIHSALRNLRIRGLI